MVVENTVNAGAICVAFINYYFLEVVEILAYAVKNKAERFGKDKSINTFENIAFIKVETDNRQSLIVSGTTSFVSVTFSMSITVNSSSVPF